MTRPLGLCLVVWWAEHPQAGEIEPLQVQDEHGRNAAELIFSVHAPISLEETTNNLERLAAGAREQ